MGEFALIEEIRRRCAVPRADVILGIGDDAALLQPRAGSELAVSTDTLVAGVHFPAGTAPFDIGWKSLAVNLSDLAAMGAEPAWALLALSLPAADADWLARLVATQEPRQWQALAALVIRVGALLPATLACPAVQATPGLLQAIEALAGLAPGS